MTELCAEHLVKTYPHNGGRLAVMRDLSFRVPRSAVTVVLGQSGCGKTTLLRVAGGLEAPDAGRVTGLDAERTAFAFQEPRLMPWLTAEKNVAFGMRRRGRDRESARSLLRLVGLEGFERSRPDQLSGGMRQRVALARALASEPDYLLMDEPFAALDPFTRAAMQRLTLRVREERRVGMLFVTHSVDEALAIADVILVMAGGAIRSAYPLDTIAFPRDLLGSGAIALKRQILDDLERKEAS